MPKGEKQDLEQLAKNFELYASDQHAFVSKGWVKGRQAADAKVRAEIWTDAAEEIRARIAALETEEGKNGAA